MLSCLMYVLLVNAECKRRRTKGSALSYMFFITTQEAPFLDAKDALNQQNQDLNKFKLLLGCSETQFVPFPFSQVAL